MLHFSTAHGRPPALTRLVQIKHEAIGRQGRDIEGDGVGAALPLLHVPLGGGGQAAGGSKYVDGVGLQQRAHVSHLQCAGASSFMRVLTCVMCTSAHIYTHYNTRAYWSLSLAEMQRVRAHTAPCLRCRAVAVGAAGGARGTDGE